jgi:hypothetical protein
LGNSYLARIVESEEGPEILYLCRQYDATQAVEMGLVNKVVPLENLEHVTLQWARDIQHSPLAIRCLKAALRSQRRPEGLLGAVFSGLPPIAFALSACHGSRGLVRKASSSRDGECCAARYERERQALADWDRSLARARR